MPFLKFSRDKRGYENYYLFEPPPGGRHGYKGRPRLLFWFRTPPQVKVGRMPFSDDVRKMVEAQNPGVSFDWARIMATPIPSPEVDHWRERRRAEKAARRAAREAEVEIEAAADVDEAEKQTTAVAEEATADRADAEAVVEAVEVAEGATPAEIPAAASDGQGPGTEEHRRRRRRRRGRRGRHGHADVTAQPGAPASAEVVAPEPDAPGEPEKPPTNEV